MVLHCINVTKTVQSIAMKMLIRYFFLFKLWLSSFSQAVLVSSAEWNHLGNFGTRHYEEHLLESYLNLGEQFRKMKICGLKIFLFSALVAILFSRAEPF